MRKLAESGLTPHDADVAGITEHTETESAAFGLSRNGSGLRIPYRSVDGEPKDMFRYRYQQTEGTGFLKGVKLPKYLQPPDTDSEIYFPHIGGGDWAEIAPDPNQPLIITEGELKAACLTKNGLPCVGIGGVWNFGNKKRQQKLLPDLQAFEWRGRKVYIIFDSDMMTNPQVMAALNRLARRLTDEGAHVYVVRIPPDGDKKVGCDDFVVKHGIDELKQLMEETEQWGPCEELHKLNAEVCYVKEPNLIAVYPREDRPMVFYAPKPWVNDVMADRLMTVKDAKGNMKEKSVAAEWMKWLSRRKVTHVDYVPGEGLFTAQEALNSWTGWGVTPAQGDVNPFVQVVEHAIPDPFERTYFLDWLAYPLQHPGAKMPVAVVLGSLVHGVGKSSVAEVVKEIYGEANSTTIDEAALSSAFNGFAAEKQFIVGEEIEGRRQADMGIIKNLISNPYVMLRKLYQDGRQVRNLANYLFLTNYPTRIFRVDEYDRRLFLIDSPAPKLPVEVADSFYEWKAKGGASALFDYLLRRNLSKFNPNAHAPVTKGKLDAIAASRPEHEEWVRDLKANPDAVVIDGGPPRVLSLHTAKELLTMFGEHRGCSVKALTLALREAGFVMACDGRVIRGGYDGLSHRLWIVRDTGRLRHMSETKIVALFNSERSASKFKRPTVVPIRGAK
jgi:hypothetical protein